MKKLLVLFTVACTCIGLAFAGGTKEESGSGKPFVGLAMHNQTETWAVQFKNTFVEYAKSKGFKVTVTDANKDVTNQVGQIEDLVSLGVDSLVVLPADYTALGQALKIAYNAGVKIVNADSKVVEDDQKFVSCFITADCYSGGYAIGKYLSTKLARNAKIGALNYPQLSVIAVRFDGLADALKDAGRSDVTIINKDATDLSAISSYTEDMLMANPDISAFVCLNDNTALSCASTCRQMGKKNIMVFGFDGSPAAKQAIAVGEMTGSGVYSPIDLAKSAVDAVNAIINGAPYERETLVNMWLIDPDNIKKMDLKNWS